QFLGNIKNTDAIAHIVRCFQDPDVVHVEGSVDPIRDIEVIDTELMLADLASVEKRLERTGKLAKGGDKEALAEIEILQRLRQGLNEGIPARSQGLDADQKLLIRELFLLTLKPVMYVANVDEKEASHPGPAAQQILALAEREGSACVVLSGAIESE